MLSQSRHGMKKLQWLNLALINFFNWYNTVAVYKCVAQTHWKTSLYAGQSGVFLGIHFSYFGWKTYCWYLLEPPQ